MLEFKDIDDGTKKRTLARVFVSIYTALAVWKVAYALFFGATNVMWLAALMATALMLFGLGVDVWTTYRNNDYTQEGQVGTYATRVMKEDPAVVVDVYDPDEDDDDNDDEEEDDGEVDEVIDDEVE